MKCKFALRGKGIEGNGRRRRPFSFLATASRHGIIYFSYLNESSTRVRYATTLPSSTFMSIFTTSAMRRSRRDFAAAATAFIAASSQDFVLVPITSTIL